MSQDREARRDSDDLDAPCMRGGGGGLGDDAANTHRELERSPLVSMQECWRVVKEAESLVIALGTISGGLTNTVIATLAAITSYLAATFTLLSLVTGQCERQWQLQEWQVIIMIIIGAMFIALIVALWVGREIRRIRFFSETGASRSTVRGLLANRRSILDRCLKECRKAVHSGDEGGLVLCSDAEKLLEALNKILGTDSPRPFRRLLGRLRAWLRRWVRAPS